MMKKIDAWLDIQRFVAEAHRIPIALPPPEVEVFARASRKRFKGRSLLKKFSTHKTI